MIMQLEGLRKILNARRRNYFCSLIPFVAVTLLVVSAWTVTVTVMVGSESLLSAFSLTHASESSGSKRHEISPRTASNAIGKDLDAGLNSGQLKGSGTASRTDGPNQRMPRHHQHHRGSASGSARVTAGSPNERPRPSPRSSPGDLTLSMTAELPSSPTMEVPPEESRVIPKLAPPTLSPAKLSPHVTPAQQSPTQQLPLLRRLKSPPKLSPIRTPHITPAPQPATQQLPHLRRLKSPPKRSPAKMPPRITPAPQPATQKLPPSAVTVEHGDEACEAELMEEVSVWVADMVMLVPIHHRFATGLLIDERG